MPCTHVWHDALNSQRGGDGCTAGLPSLAGHQELPCSNISVEWLFLPAS